MSHVVFIHSYLYLPPKYDISEIKLTSNYKYIHDTHLTKLYGLCNIPSKKDLFFENIFIDTIYNNNYSNDNEPEPLPGDIDKEKYNYKILVSINNYKLKDILKSKKIIYSLNVLIYLIEKSIDFFCLKNIFNQDNYNLESNIIDEISDQQILINFENNICKKHYLSDLANIKNDFFLELLDILCKKNTNKNYKININGGILSIGKFTYSYITKILCIKDIEIKNILIISNPNNVNLWTLSLTRNSILFLQINKVEDFLSLNQTGILKYNYILIDYNILFCLVKNYKFSDINIKWNKIIFDNYIKFLEFNKFEDTMILFNNYFKWFIIDKYMSDFKKEYIKNIANHLIKCENLKDDFIEILQKNIIFENKQIYLIEKQNLILNFSESEMKNYQSSVLSNKNNLYLSKLCCYPDNFFQFNQILLQSNTISQYKQIIDNFYNNSDHAIKIKNYILDNLDDYHLKENLCAICLENIKNNDYAITICGHVFCYSCINSYINSKQNEVINCPKCRNSIKTNQIFKINETNEFLNLNEYNYHYLSKFIGTKLTFILNYCSKIFKSKECKLVIFSQYFSFLDKINQLLNFFNFKNYLCFGDDNQQINTINDYNNQKKSIILIQSNYHIKRLYFKKLDTIIFTEPYFKDIDFEDKIVKKILTKNLMKIKVLKLIIDNTIEKEI